MTELPGETGTDGPAEAEIEAFQTATRDLIGVALRSLEALDGEVSLPQLRALLALRDHGGCPSVRLAEALGLGASSVTRLADRLTASGHIRRGHDPHNRSVVTLELTRRGEHVVTEALRWRHDEFARVLSGLEPGVRAQTAAGLRAFHAAVGGAYTEGLRGVMPL